MQQKPSALKVLSQQAHATYPCILLIIICLSTPGSGQIHSPGASSTPCSSSARNFARRAEVEIPALSSSASQRSVLNADLHCEYACGPPCSGCLGRSMASSFWHGAQALEAKHGLLAPAQSASVLNMSYTTPSRSGLCGHVLRRHSVLPLHVLAESWTGLRTQGTGPLNTALHLYTMPCAVLLPVAAVEGSESDSWAARPPSVVRRLLETAAALMDRNYPGSYAHEEQNRPARPVCPHHVFITHSSKAGSLLAATRVLAAIISANCTASLLHGGMHAWAAQSGALWPISSAPHLSSIPLGVSARSDMEGMHSRGWPLLRISELQGVLHQGCVLVDVRSQQEFQGEASGYSYLRPALAFPGAKWGGGGGDAVGSADLLPRYWDSAGYLWAPRQACAWLEQHRLTPSATRPLVLYCGTAWRSSAVWAAMSHCFPQGMQHVWVLDGGVHAAVKAGLSGA